MVINHIPKQNGTIPFFPQCPSIFSNALLISSAPFFFLRFSLALWALKLVRLSLLYLKIKCKTKTQNLAGKITLFASQLKHDESVAVKHSWCIHVVSFLISCIILTATLGLFFFSFFSITIKMTGCEQQVSIQLKSLYELDWSPWWNEIVKNRNERTKCVLFDVFVISEGKM